MLAFVTVGSTQFNDLIEAVDSSAVYSALRKHGYSNVSLQIGAGAHEPRTRRNVEWFRYKPSLASDMRSADLIIGHAGSGTITEALRLGKPMVVVVNESLMDNHQMELGSKLAQLGYVICTTCDALLDVLENDLPAYVARRRALDAPRADLLVKQLRTILPTSKKQLPVKSLIVLGSGGHTSEMTALMSNGVKALLEPRCYVVAETDSGSPPAMRRVEGDDDTESAYLCRIPRSREVKQSYITSVWTTLVAFFACFPLIWREQPRVILTNGPGTCLPLCIVARLLVALRLTAPCDIVFIESAARVQRLSLSGWLLLRLRLCALFIVQWPELSEQHKEAILISLFF